MEDTATSEGEEVNNTQPSMHELIPMNHTQYQDNYLGPEVNRTEQLIDQDQQMSESGNKLNKAEELGSVADHKSVLVKEGINSIEPFLIRTIHKRLKAYTRVDRFVLDKSSAAQLHNISTSGV